MRRIATAIALAGLVASATPAWAQPAPVDDPIVIARGYVRAAILAQDRGLFDDAIRLYERANVLAPHPVMLFNLGQAHRLAGHRDLARRYYRDYLATAPTDDTLALATDFLAALDAQYERERPAEEAAAREAELAKIKAEREAAERVRLAEAAKAAAAKAALDEKVGGAVAETRAAAEARSARNLRIGGASAAALGVVGLGVATYFGVKARGIEAELERTGVFDSARRAEGDTAERGMVTSLIAGGALMVGGAVIYWLGHRNGRRAERAVLVPVPAIDGSGASVALVGRY